LKNCNPNELISLIQACHAQFTSEKKLLFLKRLAEIVVKVCAFLEKNNEIVQFIA